MNILMKIILKMKFLLETILLKVKENKFNKNECVVYDDNSKNY